MGGRASKKKNNEGAMTVATTPAPPLAVPANANASPPAPLVVAAPPQALPVAPTHIDMNASLNEIQTLFSEDAQWLDESEIIAQEDEDAKLARELTAVDDSSLESWLNSRVRDIQMTIKIVNTVTHTSRFIGAKTVEYTIETETGTVKRRYRDFVALRYGLEVRFPGAVVPPLPPNKRLGKTGPDFVVKRRRLLQLFLQTLARHPFLSADDLYIEFIASTARFDRKAAWRQRSQLKKAQKWSTAAKRWAQALLEAQSPLNPQSILDNASAEFSLIQKHLNGIKGTMKVVAYRSNFFAGSVMDLGTSFQRSSEQEGQLMVLSGAVTSVDNERLTLNQVFAGSQNLSVQHAKVIQETTDMVDDALLCPIRFEMAMIETFLEALRRTKLSINRHRQAVGAYRTAREQSELAAANKTALVVTAVPDGESMPQTDASRVAQNTDAERLRQKLQKTRLSAVQAQMAARRDINGVLLLELQRCRDERALRISKALEAYNRVQHQQASRIETIWRTAHFPLVDLSQFGNIPPANSLEGDEIAAAAVSAKEMDQSSATVVAPPSSSVLNESSIMVQPSRRGSQMRAKYEFRGMNDDELDVNAGDVLIAKDDDENPDWVQAKSLTSGKEGLVPKTYLEDVDGQGDGEEDSDDDENGLEQPSTGYSKQSGEGVKGTKRTNDERS